MEEKDINICYHKNLRDPNWSMFRDVKHIKRVKAAKFAANIIRALKISYGISSKRELFSSRYSAVTSNHSNVNFYGHPSSNSRHDSERNAIYNQQPRPLMSITTTKPNINVNERLMHVANYQPKHSEFEIFKNNLQRNLQNVISATFERG